MLILLENCVFVLAIILGFSILGGFAIIPFRRSLPFALLTAPLAGLLVTSLGTVSGYAVLKLSIPQAAGLTAGVCTLATVVTLWVERRTLRFPTWQFGLAMAGLVLTVLVVNVGLQGTTAMQMGGPALLYWNGTDHLGYAHAADWLNTHRVSDVPKSSPTAPYESWPSVLFAIDPRFGTFCLVAVISWLYNQSGMFSYSIACAVVATTTMLGVAAVFSRTQLALILLTVGLLTCHWFDYSYTGYFAKMLSFPAILFLAGLLFVVIQQWQFDLWRITLLILLTAATTLTQSGLSTALFLAILGIPFLGLTWLEHPGGPRPSHGLKSLRDGGLLLVILLATAVLSSGGIARPLALGFPNYKLPWDYILPRLAELETQGFGISGLTPAQLQTATWVTLGIWIGFAAIAVQRRLPRAIALQLGPMLLLAVLLLVGATGSAFQMIGLFFPLALCGAASLLEEPDVHQKFRWNLGHGLVTALIVLTLVMHQPRFAGMVSRYCTDQAPKIHQFSAQQMNGLAQAIGQETVDIDIQQIPQFPLAILVELGRRGLALQWLPNAWNLVLGYQNWPSPTYPAPGTYRLTLIDDPIPAGATVVYETNQYRLFKPSQF